VALCQSSVAPYFAVQNVKPDLMLVTVVSWTLFRGLPEGLLWAFIGGICLDLLSGGPLGAGVGCLLVISLLTSLGGSSMFRTHIALPLVSIVLATLLYYLLYMSLLQLLTYPVSWLPALVRTVPSAMFVNALAMLALYPLLRWLHRVTGRQELRW
jgi:rod shape-determining protein MreD